MKNTKIVALVAAVALLVLGTAFASFAATYNWYEDGVDWRCADKDGEDYYDSWAKSGDGWYYLGEDGYMLRDALVEVENGKKYVDANGRMVTNDWKKVTDDEGNEHYMYFQSNGKAVVSKMVNVNGSKYAFDEFGYMLSGWVLKNDDAIQAAESWQSANYFCGDDNDGAVKTGWQAITVDTTGIEDFDETEYWFYFGTNGVKVAAEKEGDLIEKSVNGKTYAFDSFGRMQAGWQTVYEGTDGEIRAYAWFQSVEIGAKFANGWFKVVPSGDVDKASADDESEQWFYAKKGHLAYSEIKTINGKKYGFNKYGEMVSGLNIVESNEYVDNSTVFTGVEKVADVKAADLGTVYFFSADADTDGSMKAGLQTVDIDGDAYSFYFAKQGYGVTKKQGGKYYWNGLKVAANEDKADYQVFEFVDDENTYVECEGEMFRNCPEWLSADDVVIISKTGVIASSGTKKDGTGWQAKWEKNTDLLVPVYMWHITRE